MTDDRPGDEHAPVRLFRALTHDDPLTTAEADAWIAALVQAEADGADVDDDPVWAAVLHHLDHCAECLARYEALADDLQAVTAAELGHGTPEPPSQPANPLALWQSASTPLGLRQSDEPRTFLLTLSRPSARASSQLRERPAVYGTGTVGESLGEHATVTVSAGTGDYADVRVEIAEAMPGQPWQVQLKGSSFVVEAQTDAQGIAVFRDIPLDRESEIVITGREVPTE